MFAKVSNFHWSFMPDGSYDISVDLVSIGDVVESFKINALNSGFDSTIKAEGTGEEKDPSKTPSNQVIASYANQSDVGNYFWKLIKENPGIQTQAERDKNFDLDFREINSVGG